MGLYFIYQQTMFKYLKQSINIPQNIDTIIFTPHLHNLVIFHIIHAKLWIIFPKKSCISMSFLLFLSIFSDAGQTTWRLPIEIIPLVSQTVSIQFNLFMFYIAGRLDKWILLFLQPWASAKINRNSPKEDLQFCTWKQYPPHKIILEWILLDHKSSRD